MKKNVNIGLVGHGVVGSKTLQLLRQHRVDIEARVGARLDVRWVCSLQKISSPWMGSARHTTDWRRVIADPEVDCVVELIGGINPARELAIAALKAGKHLVTANKAILSRFWTEIFGTAQAKRRLVYFEAAVGGGVPVVQALNEGLAGNEIDRIVGILNGTTNFILTKMIETGDDFSAALRAAQKAGFAEADPTFDIEGVDAAQKISILGSLATGTWIAPNRVYTEGISNIQAIDIRLIQERLNSTVKLLAIAERTPHGWVFRVHPSLVAKSHPFANVRNEYNAVVLHGNAVGDVMLYGRGAGGFPTASAVVSDILFLCRQIANGTAGQLPYVSRRGHKPISFAAVDRVRCRYYLRVNTKDRPGVLSQITGILGKNGVSIASVHQDTFEEPASRRGVPIILLTHVTEERAVRRSVAAIDRLASTQSKTVLLRME